MAEALAPRAEYDRSNFRKTSKVKVGHAPDDQLYTLHNDIFTRRSTFFKAAISRTWAKGDAPLDLSEHDTGTFEEYLHYVYLYELPDLEDHDDRHANLCALIEMYVLADKLGDLDAANWTMDCIIDNLDECDLLADEEAVNRFFEAAPVGGPLRKLLVDLHVHDASASITGNASSQGLLAAVFVEFSRLRSLIATTSPRSVPHKKFEVLVGQGSDQKPYTLHADVFLPRSSFLRAAESGRWGADDVPIDLTDHTTEIFNAYMHCVYFRTILPLKFPEATIGFTKYFQLHHLADKLGDLDSANLIVDRLIALSDTHKILPNETVVRELWRETPAHSPLRKLLIDWLVHEWGSDMKSASAPHDMLLAVFNEVRRLRTLPYSANGRIFGIKVSAQGKCHYHQHDDEHPKADFSRTFNVIVGSRSEHKTFTLHEDIFFPRSSFFKTARSGAWTTDESRPVDLTDTGIATFNAYLHCVYLSAVPYASEHLVEVEYYAAMRENRAIMAKVVELYILADMLGDITTTNLVMDEIQRRTKPYYYNFSVTTMHRIYDSTVAGAALRRLLIDQSLREGDFDVIPASEYPHALLADMHESYRRRRYYGDELRVALKTS
nr:hypothetical protein B0A51_04186 [Rachicladosporium sp. CCFEE 5018]